MVPPRLAACPNVPETKLGASDPESTDPRDYAMPADRQTALDELYGAIDALRDELGGPRFLEDATGGLRLAEDGIYLFFEEGEVRSDGSTPRFVHSGRHR